jgi:hypothetical protein
MPSHHRPLAAGVVGLSLLSLVGCGSKSKTSADASSSTFLPIPSCGGSAEVTGATQTGYFNGDAVTVQATLGGGTSIAVSVADSGSGALLTWVTDWQNPGTGANLAPIDDSNDATFTSPLGTSTLATMIPGTVDVVSATNPASVSDAGQGGQIEENVAFSTSSFQLSGVLTSPYCRITTSATTSP